MTDGVLSEAWRQEMQKRYITTERQLELIKAISIIQEIGKDYTQEGRGEYIEELKQQGRELLEIAEQLKIYIDTDYLIKVIGEKDGNNSCNTKN